jgi:YgiT-type zinc finger domain-containing protein
MIPVTLEVGPTVIVVEDVPIRVCGNCGEEHLEEKITSRLFDIGQKARAQGASLIGQKYVA